MTPAQRRLTLTAVAILAAGAAIAEERPLPPSRPAIVLPLPPDVPPVTGLAAPPRGRSTYLPIVEREAKARGLPSEVADAVMRVESGYDPGAMGGVGERGLMQVLPSTATMLGFRGTPDQLADPATNIRLGVTYLAGAWKRANGDLCRALMKYRAGHGEERMSALSVEYCRRAKSHLAALGSPLGAGALPAVTLGPAALPDAAAEGAGGTTTLAGGPRVRRIAGRLVRVDRPRLAGSRFWAAHASRIRSIEARLPWKRGGIMAGG